ncbi:tol-pal system protein YbgF [Desulfolutivibrio sulfoxidireducens]|nr:tol-pal system protein YbgF [Desulfolutivibrio sulfoxidireducens]
MLAVPVLLGCKTTGPIVQASTDFRLQNIEAALVKIQGEVKALEDKQAAGDQSWSEVRSKLDELTSLVRSKAPGGLGATEQETPPPWAGSASTLPAGRTDSGRPPKGTPASAGAGQPPVGAGGTRFPPAEPGRPFPGTPPGQTAQAVQDAASFRPSPPPATPAPGTSGAPSEKAASEPLSPAGELAAASPPVSPARPAGNPAKTWELPGPGDGVASGATTQPERGTGPAVLSPYPAEVPTPQGLPPTAPPAQAKAQTGPVATAVQAPSPPARTPAAPAASGESARASQATGPEPKPVGAPSSAVPAATASPYADKSSAAEEADYNKALKLALNGKPREAKAAFSEFLVRHPQSRLEPNVLYWIGESDFNQGDVTEAAKSFTDVSKRFPGHHKAADSLYKLGMAQEKLGNTAQAKAAYEALAKDYPASELAGAARRKAEQLSR